MAKSTGFRIARIFGIPIYLDATWLVVFSLITWTIVQQYSKMHPQWSNAQHWLTGVLTSLLFFSSVVFHELSHSVVAQHYKIRVLSITLFLFGGVARIQRDPSRAIQEFNIAVAGPLASGFLSAVFWGITRFYPFEAMSGALATWLWQTNLALAVFNLLPGFPLDGGRIFRAIVWGITGNFSRATRVAGASGRLVGYALILVGAWMAFHSDIQNGLWIAFVGWFILNAAQDSVAQLAIREALTGLRASDVMSQEIPFFAADHTLEDYASEVLRTGRRCHLVFMDNRFVGMISAGTLGQMPREEWPRLSVQAVMVPRDRVLYAQPDEPLLGLLDRLLAADVNQIPVVRADHGSLQVVGMITRDSILRVMQTRAELGTPAASSTS